MAKTLKGVIEEGNRLKALGYTLGRLPGTIGAATKASIGGAAMTGSAAAVQAALGAPEVAKYSAIAAAGMAVAGPPLLTAYGAIKDYRGMKKSLDRADAYDAAQKAKAAAEPWPKTTPGLDVDLKRVQDEPAKKVKGKSRAKKTLKEDLIVEVKVKHLWRAMKHHAPDYAAIPMSAAFGAGMGHFGKMGPAVGAALTGGFAAALLAKDTYKTAKREQEYDKIHAELQAERKAKKKTKG